ncbi:hypothetical protein [Neolewinella antarctica]|uniref:SWIM-type domain-containing protein n=1 Tax=Neolewinella antarctica TaxID=442734 RepID=A0ABX0XD31_9BACT|nr:hypothetical protein [Neolewinella antarctica]NJC26733.1 hypothetical protein [Neolewinella antarctica]
MSTKITSADDLLHLAGDAKTLEAGRRLFYSKRWRLVGGDGQWLWGEFPFGNSDKASETAVELTTGRYFCNCRGRQRPCAHGLAIVLMLKNDQERITVGQPPSWVRSVQHRATKPPAPVKDDLAATDRRSDRIDLMTSGVQELELRLLDVARRGIADTLAQGPDPFLSAAARLTDAKLPGPAGVFRRLAALGPDGNETDIARALGDLYLFVRAWKNRDELPKDRYGELAQFAGLKPKKEEILSRPGRNDHWLVLGVVEGAEDRLRFRRVWLRGEKSKRFALVLDYAFGEMPYERSWPLGASFQGAVHYYPGSYPQRAVFPAPTPGGRPYDGLVGYEEIKHLKDNYQKALALNPWLYAYPVYLANVTPVVGGRETLLVTPNGETLLLDPNYEGKYRLLALSGGGSIAVFGEFNGYHFNPLSLIGGGGILAA